MSLSRRAVVRMAIVGSLGLVAGPAATMVGAAVRGAAPGLRPTARGTSSTRCALCGATGHSMLDPGCPAARRVI
jgi:hypothetical protein